MPHAAREGALSLEFDDNRLMTELCGAHDEHLARLEQRIGVSIHARGNRLTIAGDSDSTDQARRAVTLLYDRLKAGREVDRAEVDAAVRMAQGANPAAPQPRGEAASTIIKTPKRAVAARSPGQEGYILALHEADLVFGLGPAGTGKTYLAVAMGVSLMQAGLVERLILSRPAVEAGERLGFLPGDLREKVDPYLRPLYDALYDMMPAERVVRRLESGEIEVAPLAFMRGRTLSNAFIILDEAQNTTAMQMKMLLTRMGESSRMVVTGDLSQVDLPRGVDSGLRHALEVLQDVEGVRFVQFNRRDVVRHDLVSRIVQAYEHHEGEQREFDFRAESPGETAGDGSQRTAATAP